MTDGATMPAFSDERLIDAAGAVVADRPEQRPLLVVAVASRLEVVADAPLPLPRSLLPESSAGSGASSGIGFGSSAGRRACHHLLALAWLPAVAAIEALHGLTFALLHLTCMRLLAQCVPRHLEATALTIYGTVGIGIATALLTLACGPIFERFGAHGFWAMAALCAAALPLALTLREPMAGSR
jgi:MFS family permease